MILRAISLSLALAAATPGQADAPRVATDIPPVHALVARVMQGIGEPALILPPGASPHAYAMRPSEAAALADASIVVWIGEELTPWLGRAVGSLSADAVSLELLDVQGTLLLGYREGAAFEHHAHHGEHGGAIGGSGEHAHRPADRHASDHAPAHEHDEEARAHAHEGIDPHAWLDPENAKLWLGAIAATLAEADPANADSYARNAAEGVAEIDSLVEGLSQELAPLRDSPFFVYHDAYHYFEHRFGIEASGAISLGDASAPSPARIAQIRDAVRRQDARCIFAEPQFPTELIETVVEDTRARIATLDPLGAALEQGPELYADLMRALAADLRDCLAAAE